MIFLDAEGDIFSNLLPRSLRLLLTTNITLYGMPSSW